MDDKTDLELAIMYNKAGNKNLTIQYLFHAAECNEEIVEQNALRGYIRDILSAFDAGGKGNMDFIEKAMRDLEKIVQEHNAECAAVTAKRDTEIALNKIRRAKRELEEIKKQKKLNAVPFILAVLFVILIKILFF